LIGSRRVTDILIPLGRRWLGTRQLNHLVRFEPVLELVLSARSQLGLVLDVGSGSHGITTLLPAGWRATSIDADFDDYASARGCEQLRPDQLIGDVRALPFGDCTFDVAVAVDLLEHVPPDDRAQAVREICRVTRRRAVIAFPAGETALAADRRLASWFVRERHPVPGWLKEHLEYGFPEANELAEVAGAFGRVSVLGNESVRAHERIVAAEHRLATAALLRLACRPLEYLMTSRRLRARRVAASLLRLIRGHDRPPAYRAVLVVDRSLSS
jgi:SAM-dependent methyltransferase